MSKLLENLKSLLAEQPWSDDLQEDLELVKSGDWTDSHKPESKTDIIKPTASGACEVEPYEAVVVLYRPVTLLDAVVPTMSIAMEDEDDE